MLIRKFFKAIKIIIYFKNPLQVFKLYQRKIPAGKIVEVKSRKGSAFPAAIDDGLWLINAVLNNRQVSYKDKYFFC